MQSYKKDFPIFQKHPELVYLDSAASTQKPNHVIQGMVDFMSESYANIHRGAYQLSETSEELYYASKDKIGVLIGFSGDEIIYTYNATYAYNMIAWSAWHSGVLQAGDVVLVDIAEHHANIVPWQILSQQFGIIVERIDLDENFQYDIADFKKKYTERVKIVSLSAASNVTGVLYKLDEIASLLREDTFFVIDGSQAVAHTSLASYSCNKRIDALICTGHKMMTDTGLGILGLRKRYIKTRTPARGGGGMIDSVDTTGYKATSGWMKFEPGTPHIIGAVSLLKAIEYMESIGGYPVIHTYENDLIEYALQRIRSNPMINLFGPVNSENRLGTFSFSLGEIGALEKDNALSHRTIGEAFAEEGVCVRCGGHCTHPLFQAFQKNGACRISVYIYNDIRDLEKAFDVIDKICIHGGITTI